MKQKLTVASRIPAHYCTTHRSTLLIVMVLSITLLTNILVSAADSDLDSSFDGDGILTTDHAEFEQINDIVIQPDGKIVVAGHSGIFHGFFQQSFEIMVARYNIDGSLDSTFGSGGIVTTDIGGFSMAFGVALQPDGKIVVGGRGGPISGANFTVVRYNTDGSLDATFGGSGVVTTQIGFFSSFIADVVVQADGKIVVVGDATVPGAPVVTFVSTLARYNPDGSLDTTFDGDGISQAIPAGFETSPLALPGGIALQMNQKIVVAQTCVVGVTQKICVSRYNSDGSLDNTFDGDGVVEANIDSSTGGLGQAVSIQPDGKIVAAGHVFTDIGGFPGLARYNSDGSLDNSFGGDGSVITPNAIQFNIDALTLQPDGKIVIAGRGFINDPVFHSVVSVARHNSDGSIDNTFGSNGIVTTAVGTVDSGATAVAVQADGRIVAGGFGNFTMGDEVTLSDLALVRYGAPNAGSVNGGGWIESPPGAFTQMPVLTGKANFGVVSRHKQGASAPTGNTQFRFDSLNFHSTTYEWLVVSGNKAQCKGVGTINGRGTYRFMLTVIDGDQPGGDGQDKFRIRIWSESDGVIYDNELNAPDTSDPTTVLSGGNIAIKH